MTAALTLNLTFLNIKNSPICLCVIHVTSVVYPGCSDVSNEPSAYIFRTTEFVRVSTSTLIILKTDAVKPFKMWMNFIVV
jgi:hypothetical protein